MSAKTEINEEWMREFITENSEWWMVHRTMGNAGDSVRRRGFLDSEERPEFNDVAKMKVFGAMILQIGAYARGLRGANPQDIYRTDCPDIDTTVPNPGEDPILMAQLARLLEEIAEFVSARLWANADWPEELADVGVVVAAIGNHLEVDLDKGITEKCKRDEQRGYRHSQG